jgi:hypothetical protein
MTDFDPDAYLQGTDTSHGFDPDAYLSSAENPHGESKAAAPPVHGTPMLGALETGAHYASGALSLPVQAAASLYKLATSPKGTKANEAAKAAQAVQEAMTYQPRTAEGQTQTAAANAVLGIPGRLADRASNAIAGPNGEGNEGLAAAANVGIQALPAVLGVRGVRSLPGTVGRTFNELGEQINSAPRGWNGAGPATAEQVLTQSAQNSPQSMGAAAAAPRMQAVSPELQQSVVNAARQTGGAVNPETLNRHIEADSLPVKVQLTPGQASQDPALISHEMNNRGKIAGLPQLLNEQNAKLTQNVQAIRDQVGPDVFSANPVEHGDTLIKAYKDKADIADADINQKYQALRDAAGGEFPVSAPTLLKNATSALNQELLLDHAPKAVMSTLGRLADGDNMTFQNFESLRTNLARTMRSSTDGNERAAAGVIRQAMEELPLKPGAAELKPLADVARSAARTQFQAVAADPAYKAAVNDEVPPDRFVQKFVIGAPRDQVGLMRENLQGNDTATQTMGVSALDHLRQAAGVDAQGNGTFNQAGFNKHLQALSPKLGSLLDPGTVEKLETLGNVARYTQAQPKGSFVNNSNTLVGAIASHAANAAEGIANVKAGGIPVGTLTRKALENRSAKKLARETMTPYGGLTKLPEAPEK